MNILQNRLDRSGPRPLLRLDGEVVELGEVAAADGTLIDVGIRPKHLEWMTEPPRIVPVLDVFEPLGSDTMAICTFAGQELTAWLAPSVRLTQSEQVNLTFDPKNLHYFRSEDGSRLDAA